MIKFEHKISEYSYIVGLDLAVYKTGVSVYDLNNHQFIDYKEIVVGQEEEEPVLKFYAEIKEYLKYIADTYEGKIIIAKEAMPVQCGRFTTAATLQALAQVHAAVDIALLDFPSMEKYDKTGVYAISVRALFKTEDCKKPSKADVRKKLVDTYNLDDSTLTDNISDSMAVVYTLLKRKWNADIDKQRAYVKKEMKRAKTVRAQAKFQKAHDDLNAFKIEEEIY